MSSTALGILLVVGLTALIFVIRYVLNLAASKGADAIDNAIRKKKGDSRPPESESENLADRFKK